MERDTFICYKSFVDAAMQLEDTDRLKYYDRLMKYAIYGVDEKTTGFAETLFILVRPNLDSNNKKYVDGCKGGRPQKTTGYGNKKPKEEEEEDVRGGRKRKRSMEVVASFEKFIELIKDVDWKTKFPEKNIEIEQKRCWAKLGGKIKNAKSTFTNRLLPHKRDKEYIEGIVDKSDDQRITEFLSSKTKFMNKYGDNKYQEIKEKRINRCLAQPLSL